jgi:hypothetical protein
MNSNSHGQIAGKPLQLMICAALAVAMTGLSTQVIIRSAGQHQYQIASTRLPADNSSADTQRRLTVARLR